MFGRYRSLQRLQNPHVARISLHIRYRSQIRNGKATNINSKAFVANGSCIGVPRTHSIHPGMCHWVACFVQSSTMAETRLTATLISRVLKAVLPPHSGSLLSWPSGQSGQSATTERRGPCRRMKGLSHACEASHHVVGRAGCRMPQQWICIIRL